MATLKDVAQEAGVSIATVSNYINRTKAVKESKAQIIQQAIDRLHYIPNFAARSLKTNINGEIGVILPSFNDSYYVQIFQGIERYFRQEGYFVNVAFSDEVPELERSIITNFLKKKISGIILLTCMPGDFPYFYESFKESGTALVHLDRRIPGLDANFIAFDNRAAIRYATLRLIADGRRNIVLMIGDKAFSCEEECLRGYLQACDEAEIPQEGRTVCRTALNKESAFRAVTRLFGEVRADAFITSAAPCALGICESLSMLGIRVPGDVAVLSLGEDNWNRSFAGDGIRRSRRPAIIMGRKAAQLLHKQISAPATFESASLILQDRVLGAEPESSAPVLRPGLSRPEERRIRVTMLKTPQVDAFVTMLPHFERTTGIRVELNILEHRRLLGAIEGEHAWGYDGPLSDVYMVDIPWLYSLVENGILSDITAYIDTPEFDPGIFLPGSLKYFSEVGGRYYGLPFMFAPQILFYRKDLFENRALQDAYKKQFGIALRPPKTWAEFNTAASFFTRAENPHSPTAYGTAVAAAYDECLMPELYMRLRAYGSQIYNEHFEVVFDSPQTLKAYICFLKTIGNVPPNFQQATDVSVVSDFIGGDCAMLITYPSFLSNVIDLQKSAIAGKIGYDHIPGKSPILGGWSLCVSSKSSQKEQAFSFLNWACGAKIANYFSILVGQSVISDIFENDELQSVYPWLPLFHEVYGETRPVLPPIRKGKPIIPLPEIEHIICEGVYEIMNQGIPIVDAIQQSHQALRKLFCKYGYNVKANGT